MEDEIIETDQFCCRSHLKEVTAEEEEVVEVIWAVEEVMEVCLEVQWEVIWVTWEEVRVHGPIRGPWEEVLAEVIVEGTLVEATIRDQVMEAMEVEAVAWAAVEAELFVWSMASSLISSTHSECSTCSVSTGTFRE